MGQPGGRQGGSRRMPAADVDPIENDFVEPLLFRPTSDHSHDGILRSIEASQHRLGRDRIDVFYVHDIGRAQHGDAYPRSVLGFR